MEYYQLIEAATAIVMVQYQLELIELELYRAAQLCRINDPIRRLKCYYAPFAAVGLCSSAAEDTQMAAFAKTRDKLSTVLEKAISDHKSTLLLRGNYKNSRVRLSR